ncbi:MAG TPA: hypothetical protein VF824_01125 [Thermoanaerobaculia bacterium]|jgi:hypothetical protein
MRVNVILPLAILLLLCPLAVSAQTTQPGLFFQIANTCSSSVSGFAVGDEMCLLQVGSAVYTRAIFQGTLAPGAQQFGMACAGKDGNGSVIFVPPVSSGAQAVVMTVKPNSTVAIPKTFCSGTSATPDKQLLRRKR